MGAEHNFDWRLERICAIISNDLSYSGISINKSDDGTEEG
jgi:hypothetical protein